MNIIIYSTGWCVPCKNAKKLLDDKKVTYKEIDIEQNEITRDDLFDITGGRTVPQILINDTVIGGYSELFYLNQSGELDQLLKVS
jgi:glutaredoxin 3